jgi:hypothetical protein
MSSRRRTFLWCLGRVTVAVVLMAECALIGGSLALLVLAPLFGRPFGWFCLGALVGYLYAVVTVLDGQESHHD